MKSRATDWIFLTVGLFILAAVVRLWALPPDTPAPEPERAVAGPGYMPAGAPTDAPPAPTPRKGAISIDFDVLAAFDYDPEVPVMMHRKPTRSWKEERERRRRREGAEPEEAEPEEAEPEEAEVGEVEPAESDDTEPGFRIVRS